MRPVADPAVTSERGKRRPARRRWASLAAWRLAWIALTKVVWVRVALWRWPYARVRARLLTDRTRDGSRTERAMPATTHDPRDLAWAVRATARRLPEAWCLTQALALEALMSESGLRPDLRIGVARNADGAFEAHAWVEFEGHVVIGALPDLERFAVLPDGVAPQGRP